MNEAMGQVYVLQSIQYLSAISFSFCRPLFA